MEGIVCDQCHRHITWLDYYEVAFAKCLDTKAMGIYPAGFLKGPEPHQDICGYDCVRILVDRYLEGKI